MEHNYTRRRGENQEINKQHNVIINIVQARVGVRMM